MTFVWFFFDFFRKNIRQFCYLEFYEIFSPQKSYNQAGFAPLNHSGTDSGPKKGIEVFYQSKGFSVGYNKPLG